MKLLNKKPVHNFASLVKTYGIGALGQLCDRLVVHDGVTLQLLQYLRLSYVDPLNCASP